MNGIGAIMLIILLKIKRKYIETQIKPAGYEYMHISVENCRLLLI